MTANFDFDTIVKTVDCHLGRITLNNLEQWKDQVNQIELSTETVSTHGDVRLRSVRVAEALRGRGIGVGDLIIICGDTHSDICLPIIASFYLGGSIFPLSPTMLVTEVTRMLSLGNPKIIFCDPPMKEIFKESLKELDLQHVEIVIFGDVQKDNDFTPFSEFLAPTGTEDDFRVNDYDPNTTIATISCSSGTTGLPKGVCHTYQTLVLPLMLLNMISNYPRGPRGFYLNFSNYYWVSSIYALLMTCISGIPRLICAVPFSEEILQKGLMKFKPSLLFLSPVALHKTIKSEIFAQLDFSCVESFIVAGSQTSEDAIAAIKKKMIKGRILNGYGCTEVGTVSSSVNSEDSSMGKVIPWLKWKVVDVDTREEVKPGVAGELLLKGPTLFKCYLNDPEATKKAFDDDGYYLSGDLVTYNEENSLYFIDRVKEVIKYRNFQITPAELELEISKLPDVILVCVVGKKHKEDGEHPMAFVTKKKGSNLSEQDVHNTINGVLAEHKQLRGGVIFKDDLPVTVSGKINRRLLKQMI